MSYTNEAMSKGAYLGAEVAAESNRRLKRIAYDAREQLVSSRSQLEAALIRLRGHIPEVAQPAYTDMPDPDHLGFIVEQNVRIASQVTSLVCELSEFI